MTWAPWSKAEEASLAGYARPDANQLLPPLDRGAGRRDLLRAVYDALAGAGIRYAPEKYAPDAELQAIRSPEEVIYSPREGTCLDLALLVAGACLGYDLLPVLVVFDDHAIVAVSTRFGRRQQRDAGRGEELDWSDQGKGRIADAGLLVERISDGDYVAVECTGVAELAGAVAGPEGQERVAGRLSFDAACRAGAEQFAARRFRFALDVATLQDRWRVRSPQTVGARADYRAEVDQLLAYYAQRPLVGRTAVLDRLMRFASQEQPGCLVVEGEAMFGKSALSAELVRRADDGRWDGGPVPDIAFFFVREEQKRNSAAAFLAAVNSQLLVLLRSTEDVPGDLESQRSQLLRLWKQAGATAGPYRPLLLLVDGLDEMADDGMTILDVLPPAVQPYVHVLASSRPGVLPVLDPQHPLGRAERLLLDRLDEPALADLLVGNGVDQGDAARLAGRIERMTRGEPLFSSVVAADVGVGGEARLAELEAQHVTDMRDYFRSDVAQLKERLESTASEDVVGLLAASTGGITVEELAAVLGISRLRAERAVAPIRRFLRGGPRLRLMHRELQRIVVEDVLAPDELDRHEERLATWCASFMPFWPEDMPDYPVRHGVGHVADRARAADDPAGRVVWTERLAEAVGARFIDLHERRVDRLRWLMADLDDALDACAGDTDAGAYLRVLRTATVDARFRWGGLRPAVIFDRARWGDFDGARNRLDAMAVEEPWRQAALLLCAWLAPHDGAGWARHLLRTLAPALSPSLQVLAGRVAEDLEGAPPPATTLPPPPDERQARSIVAQIGGQAEGEDGLAEPVVSGAEVGWEIERNRAASRAWSVSGPPAPVPPDAAPVYRAEVEGPLLVSFAAASPQPGEDLLRDYIALHAANPYTQYRNRSLWVLLQSVVHHPDGAFVAELVERLVSAALGGSSVIVADCVPLTALAVLAAGEGEPWPARFEDRIADVRGDAEALAGVRSLGDGWSSHKRRLGCLAESLAVLLGDHARAVTLLEQALALPFGYAGFQAPGCLTLAESAMVCGAPTDLVDAAFHAALAAAHNVQDPGFCARTTSRVNAMTRRRPGAQLDPPTGVHIVGELYGLRDRQAGTVQLPSRITDARTLAALADDVYECSPTELVRLNPTWAPDKVLRDGVEVSVPDPEMAPLLAGRLSAEILADPGLSGADRRLRIQRLAALAVSNLTALDTVLGRLLLAVAPDVDPFDMADLVDDDLNDPPAPTAPSSAAFLS